MKQCLALILLLSILGCTPKTEEIPSNPQILRIGTLDENSMIGEIFQNVYPNIKIEMVSPENAEYDSNDPNPEQTALDRMLKTQGPIDLIVVPENLYIDQIQKNTLKPLEPLIKQANFNLEQYIPNVLEGFKDMGNGKLFGLPISYQAPCMVCNMTAFQEVRLAPPKNGVTWDETFKLASQLKKTTGKEQRYGLFSYLGFEGSMIMQAYLPGSQLQAIDVKNQRLVVDTPKWEQTWEKIAKLAREKVFRSCIFEFDKTISETSSLKTKCMSLLEEPIQVFEWITLAENMKETWDITSFPVHYSAQKEVPFIKFKNILCVPQQSQNIENAWKFIEFMAGERMDIIRSNELQGLPLTRKGLEKSRQKSGKNIEAFYQFKRMKNPDVFPIYLMESCFEKVLKENKSVKSALNELTSRGRAEFEGVKKGEIPSSLRY